MRKEIPRIGLTFGQLIAVLTLLFMIIGVWINMEVSLAELRVQTDQNVKEITCIKTDIETKRIENKNDHLLILDKIEKGNNEIMKYLIPYKRLMK
jgi:hypothetical protein